MKKKMEKTSVKDITLQLVAKVNCGDCSGLTLEQIVKQERKSKSIGKKSSGEHEKLRPCTDDLIGLGDDAHSAVAAFAKVANKLTPDQTAALGLSLLHMATTAKVTPFRFYERVYVRCFGTANSNYLGNFTAAHVLYCDGRKIVLCSSDGTKRMQYFMDQIEGTIYSNKEFKVMRNEMEEAGRYTDPKIKPIAAKYTPVEVEKFNEKAATKKDVNTIKDILGGATKAKANKAKKLRTDLELLTADQLNQLCEDAKELYKFVDPAEKSKAQNPTRARINALLKLKPAPLRKLLDMVMSGDELKDMVDIAKGISDGDFSVFGGFTLDLDMNDFLTFDDSADATDDGEEEQDNGRSNGLTLADSTELYDVYEA